MNTLLRVLVVLALSAGAAVAQEPVDVGVPFRVVATHDGVNTSGYRVYVDGAQVGKDVPVSALANGTITQDVPGQVRGPHALVVGAFNADAESRSAPLAIVALVPPPRAPTNLQITIAVTIGADGSVTAILAGVERQPHDDE